MSDSLIVIRSGATDYEWHGRIRGTVDLPLCPAGVSEAEHAATLLTGSSAIALYTSEDLGAVETGRIVGLAMGLKPRTVPRLHNLDQGLWQGLLVEDIRRSSRDCTGSGRTTRGRSRPPMANSSKRPANASRTHSKKYFEGTRTDAWRSSCPNRSTASSAGSWRGSRWEICGAVIPSVSRWWRFRWRRNGPAKPAWIVANRPRREAPVPVHPR